MMQRQGGLYYDLQMNNSRTLHRGTTYQVEARRIILIPLLFRHQSDGPQHRQCHRRELCRVKCSPRMVYQLLDVLLIRRSQGPTIRQHDLPPLEVFHRRISLVDEEVQCLHSLSGCYFAFLA